MPNQMLPKILTEEELKKANAILSFEIMQRKQYESFLLSVIRTGEVLTDEHDFEWFKERTSGFLPYKPKENAIHE